MLNKFFWIRFCQKPFYTIMFKKILLDQKQKSMVNSHFFIQNSNRKLHLHVHVYFTMAILSTIILGTRPFLLYMAKILFNTTLHGFTTCSYTIFTNKEHFIESQVLMNSQLVIGYRIYWPHSAMTLRPLYTSKINAQIHFYT